MVVGRGGLAGSRLGADIKGWIDTRRAKPTREPQVCFDVKVVCVTMRVLGLESGRHMDKSIKYDWLAGWLGRIDGQGGGIPPWDPEL